MKINAEIGARAREARHRAGFSTRAVHRALGGKVEGVTPGATCRREAGAIPWTVEQVHEMARLYGVRPAELLGIEEAHAGYDLTVHYVARRVGGLNLGDYVAIGLGTTGVGDTVRAAVRDWLKRCDEAEATAREGR